MRKTVKVIMLPTEKATQLFLSNFNKELNLATKASYYHTAQHLYILSDKNDEIKEEDWVFHPYFNNIHQITKETLEASIHNKCKKIIASTNKSLVTNNGLITDTKRYFYLPSISESFITAYIKAYNEGKPITEVQVEYEEYCINNLPKNDHTCVNKDFIIKTREDNTVIIHPAKTYTREEVEVKLKDFLKFLKNKHNIQQPLSGVGEWIEKYL